MKTIIGVCGSGCLQGNNQESIYQKVEMIGREIARKKCVLICGGKEGVMEAACKGAKSNRGLTIGILPYSRREKNKYVDVPIVTGIGEKRNSVIVQSADSIIVIAGRWGTLNEIVLAAMYEKPLVFLKDSCGFADVFLASGFIDHVSSEYVVVDDAVEAVDHAFRLAQKTYPKH